MAKKGRSGAVPLRGRSLTEDQIAKIKAEKPRRNGRYNLSALARKHKVARGTIVRHLQPTKAQIKPQDERFSSETDALICHHLATSDSSNRATARLLGVSHHAVNERVTEDTKRPLTLKNTGRFTDATGRRIIDLHAPLIRTVTGETFRNGRSIFEADAIYSTREAFEAEVRERLHFRLDYFSLDESVLKNFIHSQASVIGKGLLEEARRRLERQGKLKPKAGAEQSRRRSKSSSNNRVKPFVLLGLLGEPFNKIPVRTQRKIVKQMINGPKPKLIGGGRNLPSIIGMRVRRGMGYREIAGELGMSKDTVENLIGRRRAWMKAVALSEINGSPPPTDVVTTFERLGWRSKRFKGVPPKTQMEVVREVIKTLESEPVDRKNRLPTYLRARMFGSTYREIGAASGVNGVSVYNLILRRGPRLRRLVRAELKERGM